MCASFIKEFWTCHIAMQSLLSTMKSFYPIGIFDSIWRRLSLNRWLLDAFMIYHRWLPYVTRTTYVSDAFLVGSSVTRIEIGQEVEARDALTIVVFYYLDHKQYAIMIDATKCHKVEQDMIPYSEDELLTSAAFRCRQDEYLSVVYEGKDVTECFLMYSGPLGNRHEDKKYALSPRYSDMIDTCGNRLFQGETDTAMGILWSDLTAPQHIKIRDVDMEKTSHD